MLLHVDHTNHMNAKSCTSKIVLRVVIGNVQQHLLFTRWNPLFPRWRYKSGDIFKISNVDILKLFLIANCNKKVLLMTTFKQSHFFAFVLLQLTSKTFQYGSEGSKLESKGFYLESKRPKNQSVNLTSPVQLLPRDMHCQWKLSLSETKLVAGQG